MKNPDLISGPLRCSKDGYNTKEVMITAPSGGAQLRQDFALVPAYMSCSEGDFETKTTQCWNYNATGGCNTSDYIKQYCDAKGKMYKLTAFMDTIYKMYGPYDEKQVMAYADAVAGWEAGYIWLNMFCDKNQKWYFCRYSCTLVQV